MDYQPISNFFDRLKNIIDFKQGRLSLIVDILNKFLIRDFKKEDFIIKNKIIYIKTSPIVKNQILIKKNFLLKEINNKLSNKDQIIDIR